MIFDKLLGRQKDEEYVRHTIFGIGIVEQKKSMGFRLQVKFQDGIVRKIRSDEVTYISKDEFDRSSIKPMANNIVSHESIFVEPGLQISIVENRTSASSVQGANDGTPREVPEAKINTVKRPDELAMSTGTIIEPKHTEIIPKIERDIQAVHKESPAQIGNNRTIMKEQPVSKRSLLNISERDYHGSKREFEARQVIESLRLGIPPQGVSEDFFEVFTVGREEEIDRVEKFLEDDEEGNIVLTGEYGSGKTHMMEVTASIALREGWAVSIVELDTTEAPFSKPKSVYEKIVKSLRYMKNGRIQDFRNMLNDAAFSNKYESIMDHQYLGKMIQTIKTERISEPHYIWIEGSGNRKRPFFDVSRQKSPDMSFALKIPNVEVIQSPDSIFVIGRTGEISERLRKLGFFELSSNMNGSKWVFFNRGSEIAYDDKSFPPMHYEMTSASIYCNILSGIGYLATEILELKGLLILFDEAESVDRGYYTKHAADMGINFLRGLSAVCSNDSDLFDESDDQSNVDMEGIGRKTGLRYSRQTPIGFVYAVPSRIKTIYCFTPVDEIMSLDPFCNMERIDLTPLGGCFSKEIFENLSEYYDIAYDFDAIERISNDEEIVGLFNDGLRMGIKGVVEILDMERLKNIDPRTA